MYGTVIWKTRRPYFHFMQKTIWDGTIRVMKIMQKIGFNCQLFLLATILERVFEPLLLTIRIQK